MKKEEKKKSKNIQDETIKMIRKIPEQKKIEILEIKT